MLVNDRGKGWTDVRWGVANRFNVNGVKEPVVLERRMKRKAHKACSDIGCRFEWNLAGQIEVRRDLASLNQVKYPTQVIGEDPAASIWCFANEVDARSWWSAGRRWQLRNVFNF